MNNVIQLLIAERDKLDKAIVLLRGPVFEFGPFSSTPTAPVKKAGRRQWTAAQKLAQSRAQKARWAKLRGAQPKKAKKAA